jgi:hypothetical protein
LGESELKKKSFFISLIALTLCFSFSLGAFAAPKLSIWFNNKSQNMDIKMVSNKPYIPLNSVVSLFGGKVSYDKKTNTYKVISKDYKPVSSTVKSFTVSSTKTSGPMKLTISKVTVSPSYKYDEYSSPIKAVVLDVKVQNTSNGKVSWYPTQSIFALNTGEQIEDAIIYSDDLDGDFLAHTVKTGKIVLYIHKSNLDSIKSFQIQLDGPFNSNYDDVGSDLLYTVKFR